MMFENWIETLHFVQANLANEKVEVANQQPARLVVHREKPALIVNEESLVPKGYYAGIDINRIL